MNILYIGDVMGEMGLAAVEKVLPQLKKDRALDMVFAQAENASAGKGLLISDYERLKDMGVDACTGGDHTVDKIEIFPLLEDSKIPIIGPANMQECPGPGYKYVTINAKRVLFISLLGSVVGKNASRVIDNPLRTIDTILSSQIDEPRNATLVNFHGDFSSEKVIIGHYLDGRVSLVVGDHWHVPTADAQILPKGTAHQSDVGMCGSLDSSLGVTFESVLPRWRDSYQTRNELEQGGRTQFNALFVSIDETTGKAATVEHIRQVW